MLELLNQCRGCALRKIPFAVVVKPRRNRRLLTRHATVYRFDPLPQLRRERGPLLAARLPLAQPLIIVEQQLAKHRTVKAVPIRQTIPAFPALMPLDNVGNVSRCQPNFDHLISLNQFLNDRRQRRRPPRRPLYRSFAANVLH